MEMINHSKIRYCLEIFDFSYLEKYYYKHTVELIIFQVNYK